MIHAYKYQGAGNDFIIIDNRKNDISLNDEQVKFMCDRRFGIGGDGLMLLGRGDDCDFSMKYYNSDGFEGTMCGNGGRCLVAFAARMGIKKFNFFAIDGYHHAELLSYTPKRCMVRLKMKDVNKVEKMAEGFFLNTGSDHFVIFTEKLAFYDVYGEGKRWRHDSRFPMGSNVNFVEVMTDKLFVRTFERGVEDETFACGTGVTAASIASYIGGYSNYTTFRTHKGNCIKFQIKTIGDDLSVDFIPEGKGCFKDIFLTGPATYVFDTFLDI